MSKTPEKTASAQQSMGGAYILRLGISLLVITAVVAVLLALVNEVTKGPIAEQAEAARQAALATVIPGADKYEEMACEDETVNGLSGAYVGSELTGYCVEVSPGGFGGAIDIMVGLDTSGTVLGAVILDHSETAGLGSKAEDPAFLAQYVGKTGTITVNSGENSIQGITGSTVTSKAVTDGVNMAIAAMANFEGGGS